MKRRPKPGELMKALKAAAADIPPAMARMSEQEVVDWVKAARREIRKEKEAKSRASTNPQASQGGR